MSRSAQTQIPLTKNIRFPNSYIQALYTEYKDWAFDESTAPRLKGKWKQKAFNKPNTPLHLEIGPGNGKHLARLCLQQPEDCFLSIELKYKPLIQSLRRVRRNNSSNGKMIRYNARLIEDLFDPEELNNVYIHFPDPWLKKKKQKKHQLIQTEFCKSLYSRQKPGSFLEFKTDSEDYFRQSVRLLKQAGYKLNRHSLHLYEKERPNRELMSRLSQFELLFFQKQIPIKYALLAKTK